MLHTISRIFVALALLVTLLGSVANDAVALPLDSEAPYVTLDAQKDCDADPDHSLFSADSFILEKSLCNAFPLAVDTVLLNAPDFPPNPPPPKSV